MSEPISITTVLDAFKEQWYVDWVCRVGKAQANRIGKEAMAIGTAVDETIKTGKSSPKVSLKPFVITALEGYKKWREVYQPKVIIPGKRLYSKHNDIAITGEPDLYVDDVLVDIKCASKISPKYWLQVNMYRFLEGSQGKVAILRLDKNTGAYEYVVKDYDPKCVSVWCGLLDAYVYLKGDDNGADI